MTTKSIETPLTAIQTPVVDGNKLALISIPRAGNGLLDEMLDIVPPAKVGYIGMHHDPDILKAVECYLSPPITSQRD